jgi:2'-5' RNA ligase
VRFESDPFDVDRIVLYRSHLRRPRPLYERLATFGLADA